VIVTGNMAPQVLVVGDQRLADALAQAGAQWHVYPAAPTVTDLWDRIESGALPGEGLTAIFFTDGTGRTPDELESSLAAFAPYTEVFVIATAARSDAIVARAKELAKSMEDGDPERPIWTLPIEDLVGALSRTRQILINQVAWPLDPVQPAAPAAPAYVAPAAPPVAPVAPPVAQPTAPAAPAYVAPAETAVAPVAPPVAHPAAPAQPAPGFQQPLADQPAAAPAPQSAVGYEQANVYGAHVAQAIAEGGTKRPDAIPGQMTIACMSSKGGSGKSTTAICLAGMIARSSAAAGDPKKVVIVDLDTRDGQVGSLINQYMPTAVSIRVMPRWDAATVTANLVHDKRLGVDALLAPIRPRNADDVGPDFYRQIIQVLQTTHDVVILDCSVNYLDPLLGVAFSLADEILFVTTLATTSVQGMARALTELFADPTDGGLGIPRSKVGVVANQVIHNVGMTKDKLFNAALGAPLVGQIPAEHDEVLIQTNSNRMDNLLKHPRLGPAYHKLATNCLPGWNLAPITAQASAAETVAQGEQEQKKKGFFGR
jgi:MinD-like ATPase involved in chromosome partitioning or flagellar assembly